jgi:hypothetical protein
MFCDKIYSALMTAATGIHLDSMGITEEGRIFGDFAKEQIIKHDSGKCRCSKYD